MDTTTIVLSSIIALLLAGFLAYIFWIQRKEVKNENLQSTNGNIGLQLQAYERLILLVDRIALPNLISRLNHPDLNVKEMQLLLTQTIKQEFEHNITQQIYVSAEAWNAVKGLKEQTMLVVNQFGNVMPVTAKAIELNKTILEYVSNTENLNDKVSSLLNAEVKKIL